MSFTGNDECPAGYYCPVGTTYPEGCPVGTYSEVTGLSDVSECLPCPPGRYCIEIAFTGGLTAAECDAG